MHKLNTMLRKSDENFFCGINFFRTDTLYNCHAGRISLVDCLRKVCCICYICIFVKTEQNKKGKRNIFTSEFQILGNKAYSLQSYFIKRLILRDRKSIFKKNQKPKPRVCIEFYKK